MKTGQVKRARRHRRAFTLIEVMIVIGIILALSGLIGVALFARRGEAKEGMVKTDLNTLRQAMDFFRLDFDRWPTQDEGLAVLWDKSVLDPESDERKWKPYLTRPMPNDQWGRAWGYSAESDRVEGMYEIWSFGPNGIDGDDDDIRLPLGDEEQDELGGRSLSPAL